MHPRSARDMRIIGGGKAGQHVAQDDVLRIEAEEPVFYIGPDTRPPGAGNLAGIKQRIRANLDALRRPGVYPVRNQAPQPLAAAGQARANGVARKASRVRPNVTEPVRRAPPPPEPPPEPSGRVRVAELTSLDALDRAAPGPTAGSRAVAA